MNIKLVHVSLLVLMLALITGLAIIRAGRTKPEAPARPIAKLQSPPKPLEPQRPEPLVEAPRPPEDPKKQAVALNDSMLAGLIENARMAEQRGDATTRDAMLFGLRKSPERSRELISKQISTVRDDKAALALRSIMERLK